MIDVRKKFREALQDTVDIWKARPQVKGVFVHGSYAGGTATFESDLDVGVIWDSDDAPVELLSEHKGVRIDMTFLTPKQIDSVLKGEQSDPLRVAEVMGRLKNAQIALDTDGTLSKWKEKAAQFKWSPEHIATVKKRAMDALERASKYANREDTVNSVHEIRLALFDLGRVIVMKNNELGIIKPSEVLSGVRMLDPIAYQLFLRTFKLKGLEEEDLTGILEDVKHWLGIAEERCKAMKPAPREAVESLAQAQREYYGAMMLTVNGDYELAVLEMRHSIHSIGVALLAMDGVNDLAGSALVDELRERETEFYDQILVEYGAFDFQPKGIERSIGEAKFIAQRL
ncbi:MAG: nucleotidyltransferase domain-containing protein [Candidatus Thorarchaeota archaeon]|nr:nucleotidyltransferase domain-containing protein [Candidatus Thorarchaeota archaeon]